jgi:hypothetical protein
MRRPTPSQTDELVSRLTDRLSLAAAQPSVVNESTLPTLQPSRRVS